MEREGSISMKSIFMEILAVGCIGLRTFQNLHALIAKLWFYFQALRNKRQVEQLYEDAQSKINELTTANVNLVAIRSKLEQELGQLAGDFEEAHKELRVGIRSARCFIADNERMKKCKYFSAVRRALPTLSSRTETYGRITTRRAGANHQNRGDQEIVGDRSEKFISTFGRGRG